MIQILSDGLIILANIRLSNYQRCLIRRTHELGLFQSIFRSNYLLKVENIRAQLSKSIIAQINISTKKQATNAEIGATLAFFYDLLEGKPIKSWDETNTIQMDVKNSNLVEAIMETIVVRYQVVFKTS